MLFFLISKLKKGFLTLSFLAKKCFSTSNGYIWNAYLRWQIKNKTIVHHHWKKTRYAPGRVSVLHEESFLH